MYFPPSFLYTYGWDEENANYQSYKVSVRMRFSFTAIHVWSSVEGKVPKYASYMPENCAKDNVHRHSLGSGRSENKMAASCTGSRMGFPWASGSMRKSLIGHAAEEQSLHVT